MLVFFSLDTKKPVTHLGVLQIGYGTNQTIYLGRLLHGSIDKSKAQRTHRHPRHPHFQRRKAGPYRFRVSVWLRDPSHAMATRPNHDTAATREEREESPMTLWVLTL